MTPFAILIQFAGLSQREAAAFLNLSPSSIDKMARGVRSTPEGIVNELCDLIERQDVAADQALALIVDTGAESIELGYPADDHEAQHLGMPSVGAWAAMAARVIANSGTKVVLAPRGSTLSTAAATDAHERG